MGNTSEYKRFFRVVCTYKLGYNVRKMQISIKTKGSFVLQKSIYNTVENIHIGVDEIIVDTIEELTESDFKDYFKE